MSNAVEKVKQAMSIDQIKKISIRLEIGLFNFARKDMENLPPDFHLTASLIPDDINTQLAQLCFYADLARDQLYELNEHIRPDLENYEELELLKKSVNYFIMDIQEKVDLYNMTLAKNVDTKAGIFICKNLLIDGMYGIIIRRTQEILKQMDNGSFNGDAQKTIESLLAHCNSKLKLLKEDKKFGSRPGNELRREELRKVNKYLKLLIILLEKKSKSPILENKSYAF